MAERVPNTWASPSFRRCSFHLHRYSQFAHDLLTNCAQVGLECMMADMPMHVSQFVHALRNLNQDRIGRNQARDFGTPGKRRWRFRTRNLRGSRSAVAILPMQRHSVPVRGEQATSSAGETRCSRCEAP